MVSVTANVFVNRSSWPLSYVEKFPCQSGVVRTLSFRFPLPRRFANAAMDEFYVVLGPMDVISPCTRLYFCTLYYRARTLMEGRTLERSFPPLHYYLTCYTHLCKRHCEPRALPTLSFVCVPVRTAILHEMQMRLTRSARGIPLLAFTSVSDISIGAGAQLTLTRKCHFLQHLELK